MVVKENGTFGKSSAPEAFSDEGTHNFKPILLLAFNLLTCCCRCKQLAKREGFQVTRRALAVWRTVMMMQLVHVSCARFADVGKGNEKIRLDRGGQHHREEGLAHWWCGR